MKIAATIAGSLRADMRSELRAIEGAVSAGTREAGRALKNSLRKQVRSAGLGGRLANTWRDKHYPNQGHDAASLVYTKAPEIIRVFDEGAVIRGKAGRFLAIPTPAAPKRGVGGRRLTPATFPEHRLGPLRLVYRTKGPSLLVVDDVRLGKRGVRGVKGGSRTRAGRLKTGLATVVMFILVPQVKIEKRLDVARSARRWAARLPGKIDEQMRKEQGGGRKPR